MPAPMAATAEAPLSSTPPVGAPVDDWMGRVARRVDDLMRDQLTTDPRQCPPQLQEAMRYACLSPGKRLRPALVCACAQAVRGAAQPPEDLAVWHAAVAIEMLHAFSLVHDDLPAMDDDDLRRGRPTVHKAFDEATAILAGDALTVRAFELLADPGIPAGVSSLLVREVASGIGWTGVIAGQILDLQAEGQRADADAVREIHRLKTAALLRVSCRCGAVAVGAEAAVVDRYGHYGEWLGLAFQAVDDLLDEMASESQLGKRVRKDRELGKATLPAVVGVAQTRDLAQGYIARALGCVSEGGAATAPLRDLAERLVRRMESVG